MNAEEQNAEVITDNVMKITDGKDVWYFRPYGDSTHVYYANDQEFVKTNNASVLHVGQLNHAWYQDHVRKFVRDWFVKNDPDYAAMHPNLALELPDKIR